MKLRGAALAREGIVVADGAPWIWNRTDALAKDLDLRAEAVVKVAGF
jgi:hypothetical protein